MFLGMVHVLSMARILVVLGHPHSSSYSAALAEAYAAGAAEHAEVEVLDLAGLDFDPLLRAGFDGDQALEPDLLGARAQVEAADHIAWVFPTWWVGPPALVRGFIERTFLPGWGFAYEPGAALPTKLLAGRSARVITTMDSPRWWYRLRHRRALHASFVGGTLKFVGISPVRETTIYTLRELDAAGRERALERVRAEGRGDAKKLARRRAWVPALAS